MPLHFKSKVGYEKWQSYKHIHHIPEGKKEGPIFIRGKLHKVDHKEPYHK